MKKQVLGFLLLVFLLSMTSASFQSGNSSGIEEKYSQSDFIRGWINMSFSNHPGSAVFVDSLNSISLIKLLKLNNLNFSCNPTDCETDYSSSNAQSTKTINLNKDQIKKTGLKFLGENFNSISSFNIEVSSNAGESNSPQLYIDILDDENLDWIPYNSSNNFYGKDYGCYESPSEEEVFVYTQQYCNKITLPLAPSVKIGAVLSNATGGNATFRLEICNLDFSSCGFCDTSINSSGDVSCIPNFQIKKIDSYYVCINAKSSGDNNKYKINSETKNSCGYASSSDNPRDFEIFAEPSMYSSLGAFNLNKSELEKSGNYLNIENEISNYITERFESNCSSGCVVPITFLSGKSQDLTISNINVLYSSSGTQKQITDISDIAETAPKITMGFKKIFFDNANFSILGKENSSLNYTLNFDGKKVAEKLIKIANFPKIKKLTPKTAIAAYPTVFTVEMEDLGNETSFISYLWDFGDGNQETTTSNKITHTYNSTGNFTMKITAQNPNFISKKQFNISIQNPKNAINSVLGKKLNDLKNITSEIEKLDISKQEAIKRAINFSAIESKLSNLQQESKVASSDGDYIKIMSELTSIDVPIKIYKSQKADSLIFFPKKENIDINAISQITGEEYSLGNEESYRNAVIAWELDNSVSKISVEEFSGDYEDYIDNIVKFFTIEVTPKASRGNAYFVIRDIGELQFNQNYGEKNSGNYYYVEVPNTGKIIKFSTTENVGFEDLPAFISPRISELPRTTINLSEGGEIISRNTILVFSVIFAFLMGFTAYLFLQEWYKRRYENYLFGNRNDLLNLVSYVQSSYKKGLSQNDVESKLKKSGWTSEQIDYVLKKYVGKRTGMLEIPISKVFDFFKKRDTKK